MATNYAKWCAKQIKNQTTLKVNIYSQKEYELTINWLRNQFWLENEDIIKAKKSSISKDWAKISIQINSKQVHCHMEERWWFRN